MQNPPEYWAEFNKTQKRSAGKFWRCDLETRLLIARVILDLGAEYQNSRRWQVRDWARVIEAKGGA